MKSRSQDLNLHLSIIDRVLYQLSYTAKAIDPAGLEPAPRGLKDRYSANRATGQQRQRHKKMVQHTGGKTQRKNEEEKRTGETGIRRKRLSLSLPNSGFCFSFFRCAFVCWRVVARLVRDDCGSRSRTCREMAYETIEPPLLYSRNV